ncbi:MAG: DUF4184 family protein [Sediminicola sp.]
MPFTFAHPAIILPLAHLPRKWFSLTGLVIGSLTPDFEYFLRMAIKSDYSHTIGGLLWFDLPLGLAISFIFHNLVRDRLFDNLPRFLKSRFGAFTEFDWNGYFKKNWMVVVISILLGAISHIFWDGFTHDHGYFVGLIPALSNTVGLFGGHIPIFKILQHASTLVGGLFIAYAIYRLPPDLNVKGNINTKYWAIVIALSVAIIIVRFMGGLQMEQYGNAIVTAISAGLLSLILTPMIMGRSPHNKRKERSRKG